MENLKNRPTLSKFIWSVSELGMSISCMFVFRFASVLYALLAMYNIGGLELTEEELMDCYPWGVRFNTDTAQADAISDYILYLIIAGVVAVAFFAAVIFIVGIKRDENGRVVINAFDKVWTEIQLIVTALLVTGIVMMGTVVAELLPFMDIMDCYSPVLTDGYRLGLNNEAAMRLCFIGTAASVILFSLILSSIVKKIKAKSVIKCSLAGLIIALLRKLFGNLAHAVRTNDKTMLKVMGAMFGMMILAMTWIGAIVDIVIILVYVPKLVAKYRNIRQGVNEVKSGNLDYKIEYEEDFDGPKTELDQLAAGINDISQASKVAVQNELKNQRMKTDLISNVSHDLKTPLTSMITYVDLLKSEGLNSPNAPEYLKIVDEKTKRLKVLTEDLFEAAKASSGNIHCNIEAIDISALVNQALGEMDERLSASGLEVITRLISEKVMVKADGQLLWRVLENLLGNVSKYALPNSRVYINVGTLQEKDKVLLEVKNISRDELNIPVDELMERFKRGDESRNTEGSGLGLAIAKDLTKIMGGEFSITIDGDLFKASVLLDRA